NAGPVTNLGKARLVKRSETKTVPHDVKYVFNRDLAPGRTIKTSDGEDGVAQIVVSEVKVGDKVVGKKTTKSVTKAPKPAIIEMSRKGFQTSRGSFSRSTVMTVEATAYTPYDGSA